MPYQIENHMVIDACWRWQEPQEKVIAWCRECVSKIYEGDEYYDFFGDIVCDNCKDEYVKENFRRTG